jgi:hypothetical protein
MNRRDLLAVGVVTALAGCLGYELQATERVTERQVRLAELEATVAAREERIAALEARVSGLETSLATAEARRDALERQVDGPRVNDVSLVSGWERLGDVVHRATTHVARGSLATLAVNFTTPSVDVETDQGRQETAAQRLTTVSVTLTDEDGGVVETNERELRYFVETGRVGETPLLFDTRGFPPGEYVAVARVRDVVDGVDSRPVTARFTVV